MLYLCKFIYLYQFRFEEYIKIKIIEYDVCCLCGKCCKYYVVNVVNIM